MKKYLIFAASLLIIFFVAPGCTSLNTANKTPKAKYVFLFIGDGMGLAHVSMAEAYQATQRGAIANDPISFTKFPTFGFATTYSANSYITCSSASGTALSTGVKTNNGMLGVDPDTNNLTSISYKIHDNGMKVGIMSSVTIDHATPGAFYAHSASRSDYYDIALQLPKTGFEFFGGGGFAQPIGKDSTKTSVYDIISQEGYQIIRGLRNYTNISKDQKILLLQEEGKEGDLPYALDRSEEDLKLKEVVTAAIDHLYNDKGFFIMAEGGKIDWAAHSNDGKADILEVLDLADAVEVAYQFYLKHPEETLIIVTADHETGGFALGYDKGYVLSLNELSAQTKSMAVDKENKENIKTLNQKAKIGWTTTAHTGIAVPVFSIGAGSEFFAGRIDNTDIPKNICKAIGIEY